MAEEIEDAFSVLRFEINREHEFIKNLKCDGCIEELTADNYSNKTYYNVKNYFEILKTHYKSVVYNNRIRIDEKTQEIIDKHGKETYLKLVDENTNKSLTQFVTNKSDLTKLVSSGDHLVQKADPVYLDPYDVGFFDAHFYAPRKRFFEGYISTFSGNLLVIWSMTIFLIITLYFDLLKKTMDGIEKFFSSINVSKKR